MRVQQLSWHAYSNLQPTSISSGERLAPQQCTTAARCSAPQSHSAGSSQGCISRRAARRLPPRLGEELEHRSCTFGSDYCDPTKHFKSLFFGELVGRREFCLASVDFKLLRAKPGCATCLNMNCAFCETATESACCTTPKQ